jgi:FkbM family methyltransferase
VLARIERKLAELQVWVDSAWSVADWPAAIALAVLRTRRSVRTTRPIWIRPRRLNGLWTAIHHGDLSQFAIYEEVFIDGVYDLDRVSFIPDAIVDCGAYAGFFSLLAHATFRAAAIVAFEPNRRNYDNLITNIGANHLRVDARPEAVSTADGTATFSGSGCGGHLNQDSQHATLVTVADLRRVLAELHSERLLLKLDIEGEEATLLPALLPVLPQRCAIFFEWHQGSDTFQGMADLLTSHGLVTSVTRTTQFDGITFIDAFAQRL